MEGPSGIGKTTCVNRIIKSLSITTDPIILSGRDPGHINTIEDIPNSGELGIVIIDDFHRLPDKTKGKISDLIKILSDTENDRSKLIIVGINKAGQSLLSFSTDLLGRIATITFESNPESKIIELINKGEDALNITISKKDDIVKEAHGSFQLTQQLCHRAYVESEILNSVEVRKRVDTTIETIREKVLSDLGRVFFEKSKTFATGPRFRRESRAPYLYLLYWLSESKEWSLNVKGVIRHHPEHRSSVNQIVDKGYLAGHISSNPSLQDVLHYDSQTTELSVEDPFFPGHQFVFVNRF